MKKYPDVVNSTDIPLPKSMVKRKSKIEEKKITQQKYRLLGMIRSHHYQSTCNSFHMYCIHIPHALPMLLYSRYLLTILEHGHVEWITSIDYKSFYHWPESESRPRPTLLSNIRLKREWISHYISKIHCL